MMTDSRHDFADVNPMYYFSLHPDRVDELRESYEHAISDTTSKQEVCFRGASMDVSYVKHLLSAIDNSGLLDTARIVNNLYGVETDKELMDLFEGKDIADSKELPAKKDDSDS